MCDVVYVADIAVQFRTGYLERGLVVYDSSKLALHYVRSRNFVLDILSLTPLDYVLQRYIGTHPLIRFPRFLKSLPAYKRNKLKPVLSFIKLFCSYCNVVFCTYRFSV